MAQPVVIAKNQTGTGIFLPSLGMFVPASPTTITLTDFANYFEVCSDPQLNTSVASGDIIINDGTSDLSTLDGVAYLNASGNLDGPVSGAVANALVKLSDTSGRRTAVTGVTVDGSSNLSTTGTVNGSGILVGGSPLAHTHLATASLAWASSAHTGTASTFAAFTAGGVATNLSTSGSGDVSGTWPNLQANDLTITSEAQGDILYFNGTNWVRLAPGTSGQALLTQGAAANPIWGSPAAGATLQSAYDGGNTIVTSSSTPISFTLTSGGFIVNGTGTVDIGADATAQALNFGTGAAVKTVTVGSANTTSPLTLQSGTGAMSLTALGVIDIDGAGIVSMNSSGAAINIGNDAVAQPINIGTGAAARTVTVGNTTGASQVDLAAGTGNVNTTTAMAWNGVISPTSLAVSQNDYNPTGLSAASLVRQATSVDVTLTGLAGGVSGRIIVLTNISANIITLTNEDAASTAANRFLFGDFIRLFPEDSVILQYDGTSSRWRAPATSRGTVAGEVKVAFTQFGSNAATALGQHNTVTVGSNGSLNLESRIPEDFNSLVTIAAVMFPGSTNATADIDLDSTYCGLGEVYNANVESDATITYNLTAGVLTRIQANTVATGIAAGDFIGIKFKHNSTGGTSNYLGMVLIYT